MARPKKVIDEDTKMTDAVAVQEAPAKVAPKMRAVRNVVLWISKSDRKDETGRVLSAFEADARLSDIAYSGYHLHSTHYLGENELGWEIMYVFELDK